MDKRTNRRKIRVDRWKNKWIDRWTDSEVDR